MPWVVTASNGYWKTVSDAEVDALRGGGNTVTYVDPSQTSTDANGQIRLSYEALQQQQAFANALQKAAAQRALEQNQISAYGAQTTRAGLALDLVGQPKNYGKLANVMAGDPNASGLAVVNRIGRLAGPAMGQPDYASLKTYSAKDASDFMQSATSDSLTSAENEGGGATKAKDGVTGTSGSGNAPSGTAAAPRTARATVAPVGGTAGTATYRREDRPVALGGLVDAPRAGWFPGATWDAATRRWLAPSVATVRGASLHADSGQSAWEARRDALLGGQRHDDFQLAHGVTAQELNDVAKIGNPTDRLAAFNALKARPAWTAATSHGSNWRAAGDRSGSAYKGGNVLNPKTFDYNAAPTQVYQAQVARGTQNADSRKKSKFKHDTDTHTKWTGEHGDTAKTKGTHISNAYALGGTSGETMAKQPLFGPPGGDLPPGDMGGVPPPPDDLSGGQAFDPHDPSTLGPEQLQEIAAILAAPPSQRPSALEAAVRECWSLGPDGQPVYTGHYADNAAQGTHTLPGMGLSPADLGQPPGDMAAQPPGMDVGLPSETAGGKPSLFAHGGTYHQHVGAANQPPPLVTGVPQGVGSAVSLQSGLPVAVGARHGEYATGRAAQGTVVALSPERGRYTTPAGAAGASGVGATYYGAVSPPTPVPVVVAPVAVTTSGGAAPAVSGGRPAPPPSGPPAPTEAELRLVARWYAAQSGQPLAQASREILGTDPQTHAYVQSALGMARAGEIERLLGPETPAVAAPALVPAPSAPPTTSAEPLPPGYSLVNGLPVGGRVTTAATKAPLFTPDTAAPATDPNRVSTDPFLQVAQGELERLRGEAAGASRDEVIARLAQLVERLKQHPLAVAQRAMGGTDYGPPGGQGSTFVARRPTTFAAGGQTFLVGEGALHGRPGADELVSVSPSPGGSVVRVDPLQRRGVGISPAVAATANLAVPGSPYAFKAGPLAPDHPPAQTLRRRLSQGGTVYGMPIAGSGTKVTRVGGKISSTGQVKMPSGKGSGSKTVPFYMASPIPNPEYSLSRDVDQMTPQELTDLGLYTQQRLGFDENQWSALQRRARPWWQNPATMGQNVRPF